MACSPVVGMYLRLVVGFDPAAAPSFLPLVCVLVLAQSARAHTTSERSLPMIRRIVLFQFQPETPTAEIDALVEMLRALPAQISEIRFVRTRLGIIARAATSGSTSR